MKRIVVVMAIGVLFAGASGCGGKSKSNNASKSSTTASTLATDTTGGSGSTAAGSSPTTVKGGTPGGAVTTTTDHLRTQTGATVAASSTVKPPAAGVYTYDNSGSSNVGSIPPTAKLTVSAAQGARQKSVREEKDSQGNGTTTTQVIEYRTDGLYLVSLHVENKTQGPTLTFDFSPATPVLFAPLPAAKGKSWSIDIDSSDGCYHVHVDANIAATGVVITAGGGQQTTDQVASVQKITTLKPSCTQITLTSNQTLWFSEKYRLSVKEQTHTEGTVTFGAFPVNIKSDETSTLRSTTPS